MQEHHGGDEQQLEQGRGVQAFGFAAALIALLLLGASFRFLGIDWDEGFLLHPDERFLAWVTSDIHFPDSSAAFFDTNSSTANPNNVGHGFYVYGTLPIFLGRIAGEISGQLGLSEIYLPGRYLSAIFDLGSLIAVFFLARQILDARAGLIAAALYAVAALPIQLSHFYAVDTFAAFFVTVSLVFLVRISERHRWIDYLLFGLFLAMAMASKISIFPLAFFVVLAVLIRLGRDFGWLPGSLPGADEQRVPGSPDLLTAAAGILLAALVTVAVFRVAQPFAFLPPGSEEYIDAEALGGPLALVSRVLNPIGLRPNAAWLDDIKEAGRQGSGAVDFPPNHQWGFRTPWLHPLLNMGQVGMGWPLTLWAWFTVAWALWEIGRGHDKSPRLAVPVLWVLLIFLWQGSAWVKALRYFLPIYPALVALAAWGLVTAWDRIGALLAARRAPRFAWPRFVSIGLLAFVIGGAGLWGFAVSRIYTRPVTRLAASEWIIEHVYSDLTISLQGENGSQVRHLALYNNWSFPEALAANQDTAPAVQYTLLSPASPQSVELRPEENLLLERVRVNHVASALGSADDETLSLRVATDPFGDAVLYETSVQSAFPLLDDERGGPVSFRIEPALPLSSGQTYYLILSAEGSSPLVISGARIAHEGPWDDPLPYSVNATPIWGVRYNHYELNMAWEDEEKKVERLIHILDRADYIFISSNRFYDSLSRNPDRFPLSIRYYETLFAGELGFDLVADFSSRPNLGPIEFYDDEAEETWTVYDHPRVLIFQKTDAYDSAVTASILRGVDLSQVQRLTAREAQGRPVDVDPPRQPTGNGGLQLRPASWNGENRVPGHFYLALQPLAVLVWWVAIAVIGWTVFPMLWRVSPALADRGYTITRVLGLLLLAWVSWLLASDPLGLSWNAGLILTCLLALATLSTALIWPRRTEFVAWLRENQSFLLGIEGLLALLFLAFLLIRLGNPDLWHPYFGGEKPMDMSYFNAVLNSGRFPPADPWFAGGTINYYYFGFVIVGAPVKLLGIPATLAYNLIIPTLFAVTGLAAFGAAYNLVAPLNSDEPLVFSLRRPFRDPAFLAGVAAMLLAVVLGNLATIRNVLWGAAELGAGTTLWWNEAFPQAADLSSGMGILFRGEQPLPVGIGEWYWNPTRIIPVPVGADNSALEAGPITEFPFFTFLYADLHAHMMAFPISLSMLVWVVMQVRAALRARAGQGDSSLIEQIAGLLMASLLVGALRPTNTWDWPTYLLVGGLGLSLATVYRRADRAAFWGLISGALGAAVAGGAAYLQPGLSGAHPALNLLLAAAGAGLLVGYGLGTTLARGLPHTGGAESQPLWYPWLTLLLIVVQVAVLAGAGLLWFRPYYASYELAYNSFFPWEGSRTPLWAYLFIYGLFLFVIASWLLTETLALLRDRRQWLPWAGLAVLAVLGAAVLLSGRYPSALIVVPLALWSLTLFAIRHEDPARQIVLLLTAVALLLSLAVEVIVIEGDISRMNTVFKFYLQVWMLLAICAGAALGWLWQQGIAWPRAAQVGWMAGLGGLVFLAALYPLLATRAKVLDRWTSDAPATLDGMAYMPYAIRYENGVAFSLQGDYQALRWLQANVSGQPVVLEGHTTEYRWGNRVAVYTGLPAIIGWNNHQRQQRAASHDEIWERVALVAEAYNTPDSARAIEILNQFDVELIIVGDLERALYGPIGLAKFPLMAEEGSLAVLYDAYGTTIYQVIRAGGQ